MSMKNNLTIEQLRKLVSIQAEDDALWAPATYVETGYTQQALRYLTHAIEGTMSFEEVENAIREMMP